MTCETITLANTNLFIPIFLRGVFNTHYKIEKELAVGGFGIVYKGILLNDECIKERNNGNSDCVIKTLLDVNPEMFFQELSILHLFKKEKYFAKMLCYSENPYHIVLKYYKYGSLFHFIYSKNANIIPSIPYSLGASLHLAERMTYAFHLMHSKGYTQNDIKLANILLDGDESEKIFPVITDFGIAHILDSAVVAAGFKIKNVKAGTLEYCAPEVLVSFKNKQIISNDNSYRRYLEKWLYNIPKTKLFNLGVFP
jgi:serine/threonine protein kinase